MLRRSPRTGGQSRMAPRPRRDPASAPFDSLSLDTIEQVLRCLDSRSLHAVQATCAACSAAARRVVGDAEWQLSRLSLLTLLHAPRGAVAEATLRSKASAVPPSHVRAVVQAAHGCIQPSSQVLSPEGLKEVLLRIDLFERLVQVCEAAFGGGSPETSRCKHTLAHSHNRLGGGLSFLNHRMSLYQQIPKGLKDSTERDCHPCAALHLEANAGRLVSRHFRRSLELWRDVLACARLHEVR
jgi:hypothetical protein